MKRATRTKSCAAVLFPCETSPQSTRRAARDVRGASPCALRADHAECARLLGALAAEGAISRGEVESDDDLAPLVGTAWMQSLLKGLPEGGR